MFLFSSEERGPVSWRFRCPFCFFRGGSGKLGGKLRSLFGFLSPCRCGGFVSSPWLLRESRGVHLPFNPAHQIQRTILVWSVIQLCRVTEFLSRNRRLVRPIELADRKEFLGPRDQ